MKQPDQSNEEMIGEFQQKVNDLRSIYYWKGKDSEPVEFGYKTSVTSDITPELFKVVDFGNIKKFFMKKLTQKDQQHQKELEAVKAVLKEVVESFSDSKSLSDKSNGRYNREVEIMNHQQNLIKKYNL